MNKNKFEDGIKRRANQKVQERINKFEKAVHMAYLELCSPQNKGYTPSKKNLKPYLTPLMESDEKWPASLWEEEETKATNELFSLLDPVEKMLLAPELSEDDYKPDGED